MKDMMVGRLPSRAENLEETYMGYSLTINDFKVCKDIFDEALINKSYDVLEYVTWEFEGAIKFATTGYMVLDRDLKGNRLQDLSDFDVDMKHIFITVFPEGEKTHCIISWIKSEDDIFKGYKKQLESLDERERKLYLNNLIPISTENIAINPEAWDKLEGYKKDEFCSLIWGMAEILNLDNEKSWNMLGETTLICLNYNKIRERKGEYLFS